MGLRGPQPEPAALKFLKGNPGKRALNLSDGVNPPVEMPDKPPHVKANKWASQEWDDAGEELLQLGLVGRIDKASFANYCMTYGELRELEDEFAALKAEARKTAERSDKRAAVVDVYFVTTPTGFKRESALHRKITEMRKEVEIYARNFGMNPSSRMRVQPSNMIQPDLFGNEATTQPAGQVIPMSGFAKFAGQ